MIARPLGEGGEGAPPASRNRIRSVGKVLAPLALAIGAVASGCGSARTSSNTRDQASGGTSTDRLSASAGCTPIKLGLLVDVRQGSWPQVTAADVDRAIDLVSECGGEGAMAIAGQADRPLVRFSIERAPFSTIATASSGPGGRIEAMKLQRQAAAESTTRQTAEASIKRDVEKRAMEQITAQVSSDSPQLWPQLRRLSLFFEEAVSPGSRIILLFISDRELRTSNCPDVHGFRTSVPGSEFEAPPGSGRFFHCTRLGEWADGRSPADLTASVEGSPQECGQDALPLTIGVSIVAVKGAPGPGVLDCRHPKNMEALAPAWSYLQGSVAAAPGAVAGNGESGS